MLHCLLICVGLVVCAAPLHADESEWDYSGTIYMWGPSMTMTTPTGLEGVLPFYQILNDLQMTMMGAFAARRDKWSFSTDLIYMNLSQGRERDFTTAAGTDISAKGRIQMKSWIITGLAGYALHDSEKVLVEGIGGVRYLWLDVGLDIKDGDTPIFDQSGSDSFWDGVIGMRASFNLNENWFIPAYVDIGAGNSKSTWQALGGIGYSFNKFDTSLVYRYLQYKFDNIPTLSKLQVKGPQLNLTYRF